MNQITAEPLVSLVMVVKNGMPYVKDAIASVAAQTYRNFELVIQDSASTDGSLEVFQSIQAIPGHGIPNIRLESAPDNGPAQGFNRAVQRCNGAIIGSIFADDLLEPDALQAVVTRFGQQPEVAAMYGDCAIIDRDGQVSDTFCPEPFDVLRLMACELVPPFSTSFFSRAVCGDLLYFDEGRITELGFWLRLSHLPILKVDTVLSRVRVSDRSNTCNPEFYDTLCEDKISAVEQYLAAFGPAAPMAGLRKQSICGIYAWAAESMRWIPAGTEDWFNHYYEKAVALYPQSDRLRNIKLQQDLTKAQTELGATYSTLNQISSQLHAAQAELQQLQITNAAQAQSIERLREIIHAMESSKFWQMRNQWVGLQQRVKNLRVKV